MNFCKNGATIMKNIILFKNDKIIASPDDLMTVKECAQKVKCSITTIYRLMYNNKIKRYKRGYLKVSLSEVLEALEC